jgi:hypothetical protein
MRVTNTGLIGLIFIVIIGCIVTMMAFERYFYTLPNKILIRIMLLALALNLCILLFLIFSFSKVRFDPGPQGPKGTRGRLGPKGKSSNVQGCEKQTQSLGRTKYESDRKTTIVVQNPILVPDDA